MCRTSEFPEADGSAACAADDGDWVPWTYNLDVPFANGEPSMMAPDGGASRDRVRGVQRMLQSIDMVPVVNGFRCLGVQ